MNSIGRRLFLKGAGVSVALPLLEAMTRSRTALAAPEKPIRRMVLIDLGFGFLSQNLFPKKPGFDYESTPYLELLRGFRNQTTVISGTSHPDVDGGHAAGKSFLTAAPKPASANFKNTVSVDQLAAEQMGNQTRFRSLTLTLMAGRGLSFSRSGVEVPAESKPSQLFARLFVDGSPKEKERQMQRLKDGNSVMDTVLEGARRMKNRLGQVDAGKLDQYFTAVRETEQALLKSQAWEATPKPRVDAPAPTDINNTADVIGRARLMFRMIYLALQTDSTRLITLYNPGVNAVPPISGVTQDYHNLSHHGQDPGRLAELKIIETEQLKVFAEFLGLLQSVKEAANSLLDETIVMLGSDLGNGSSHDNRNLPIILAGGGFRHGQYLAFDPNQNYPLPNLYVSMLRRLGLEIDKFASSSGYVSEIESSK